ncbi:decapping and exoribonuclease protein-like [Ceratina calcarata]|uniref:Decapping nuclease n=1 Tax=Ceratina calcarata TaxID=156304 RepID=A0AAJ7NCV0_9HYME|nr:decapping and exoribonuclease protein-like [Ceratina calcarata]
MENSKLNTLRVSVGDVRGARCPISKLKLIGNYSIQAIDGKSEYLNDLSQLRYFKEPIDTEDVNFHLGVIKIQDEAIIADTEKENTIADTEKESTVANTEKENTIADIENENTVANTEKENTVADTEEETEETARYQIHFLLKWVLENLDLIRAKDSNEIEHCLQPDFICTRGPIKTLLLTPFEKFNGWILCASKFKGTIYLNYYCSDDRIEQISNFTPEQTRNIEWGFTFEEYMLSDTPYRGDDFSARCDINGEFHCVFKSKLDKKTLLYSAEIDGIRSQQVVEDTVVGKNLELIELKTTPSNNCGPKGIKDPNKMLTWWAQCYLADVRTIICGCKHKNGDIKRIKEVKLHEFLYRIKDKQKRCLSFCNGFLDFIKNTVSEEHNKCLYKFTFDLNKKEITAEELDPNCNYAFLNPWYVKKVEDYFARKGNASCS